MNAISGPEIPADLIAAEQAVVGTAISSRDAADAVGDVIRPVHFKRPAHQVILAAALRLAADGQPVDPPAVLTELVRSGDVSAISSRPEYLFDVFAARQPGWMHHALRVREVHDRDAFAEILNSELGAVGDPGFSLDAAMDRMGERLDALAAPGGEPLRPMSDLVSEVINSLEQQRERGLDSPWRDLNDAIYGVAPGQVCVVGARPGGGKSIVGGQWALHAAARLGVPALLVSMEMTAEEITTRLISARAKVPLTHLLRRDLTDEDWSRLAKYSGEVADSALSIDDGTHASLAHVRSRLRSMRGADKAGLLVIDYLTLLEHADGSESHRVGIVLLSKGLKRIAREFRIPVLVLAQLKRDADNRRPVLSDLAESSQIEADADIVLLLHRPDQQQQDSPRAGEVDVIIEKNRNGPKCTVTLAFQGHYARVVGFSPDEDGWSASRWAS